MILRWLPNDENSFIMSKDKTTSMATVTLNLTPYQQARLIDSLTAEVRKWDNMRREIMFDGRNASLDGAIALRNDAQEVLDAVKAQGAIA